MIDSIRRSGFSLSQVSYEVPMIHTRLLSAAMVALAVLSAPEALARTPYDGYWSVVIYTTRGACEPAYRTGVTIMNGQVSGGDGMATVYGRVGRNGGVRVGVASGAQNASGSGRLGQASGSGSWVGQGSAGRCSGRWIAQRR